MERDSLPGLADHLRVNADWSGVKAWEATAKPGMPGIQT